MSNKPKVTIITVVLNLIKNGRTEIFKKCVQSIQAQTYPNIEHLIIDGASTDGTIDLLKEMNLHFISEKDSGIYDAMNKGILHATGKYIAFMNSDDCFASAQAIEDVVNIFQKTNAEAVYGDSIIVNELKKKNTHKKYKIETFYYHMPVCHQSFICTVDSFKELGLFDTTYRIAGDYNSIYKLMLAGKLIIPIHKEIAHFTIGGLSTQQKQQAKDESVRSICENLSHLAPDMNLEKAQRIATTHFISFSLYRQIRQRIHPQIRTKLDWIYIETIFHAINRYLFTFHFKKNARHIRILGITIYRDK